jgi:hypothetical protein
MKFHLAENEKPEMKFRLTGNKKPATDVSRDHLGGCPKIRAGLASRKSDATTTGRWTSAFSVPKGCLGHDAFFL